MSRYILVPGDIVDFIDPSNKNIHRGSIDRYEKGRDVLPRTNHAKRDYYVKFDKPLWVDGPSEAWCALEDLELVRPTKTKASVSFTSSHSSNPVPKIDLSNIKINSKPGTQTSTYTAGSGGPHGKPDYPWTPFYMTTDEFFDILKVAFEDTYGDKSNHKWHPEDLYINISCVLEIVSNTLSNAAKLRSNKPVRGVKEV